MMTFKHHGVYVVLLDVDLLIAQLPETLVVDAEQMLTLLKRFIVTERGGDGKPSAGAMPTFFGKRTLTNLNRCVEIVRAETGRGLYMLEYDDLVSRLQLAGPVANPLTFRPTADLGSVRNSVRAAVDSATVTEVLGTSVMWMKPERDGGWVPADPLVQPTPTDARRASLPRISLLLATNSPQSPAVSPLSSMNRANAAADASSDGVDGGDDDDVSSDDDDE